MMLMFRKLLLATLPITVGFALMGSTVEAKTERTVAVQRMMSPESAMADVRWISETNARITWYFGVQAQRELDALVRVGSSSGGSSGSGGSCDRPARYDGVDALPSNIVARESGGNYGACNESSGACGKYQFLDSTWAGYGGYSSACDAPPAVQDQKAAETWADGRGCSHWSAC